jgi:phenylpropionate dioxygenase-like ring-hydroxylating dioxygenase large terminal subunit
MGQSGVRATTVQVKGADMHGTVPPERRGNEPDLRRIGLNPDFWYPVARSKDLKRGSMIAASFAGDPIALVRPDSGKVFALEDRCAHRQMPLSCGVVAGEHIKCCYHAWTYNAAGRCTVPYLPKDTPLPSGVRSYPCREASGFIFVSRETRRASKTFSPDRAIKPCRRLCRRDARRRPPYGGTRYRTRRPSARPACGS